MRSRMTLVALAILAASGCTHDALTRDTNATQQTMADLRYKHILDNLAMMADNPASLPNPVAVSSGVVQLSDNGNATGNVTWNPFGILNVQQYFLGAGGSRTVSEQWALTPLHNPIKLQLMRCAFQVLLGSELAACGDCEKKLHDFFGEEYANAIPRGWFHVGRKKDVPKGACFWGRYHDVYVWVMRDGVDGLSRFTITILDIALTEARVKHAQVTRTYEGGVESGRLKTTEVRTTEELPIKNAPTPAPRGGEPQPGPTSLQFVPSR